MFKNQQTIAIIPARDEALSIGSVIEDIRALTNEKNYPLFDRILVCDNGSIDDTASIASQLGAEVVRQLKMGYGIACLTAISLIDDTDIVVFIDADASLKIDESIRLLKAIDQGAEIAIGARITHLREKGAMTLPQHFGNIIASGLIRLIWQAPVSDLGPFRAIRYNTLQQLDMQNQSFGWTVEMQVKAIQLGLNMVEVPVHYRSRLGRSKISGTISGVIGAGYGIISTIIKLALHSTKTELQSPARHP